MHGFQQADQLVSWRAERSAAHRELVAGGYERFSIEPRADAAISSRDPSGHIVTAAIGCRRCCTSNLAERYKRRSDTVKPTAEVPTLAAQASFWDRWNHEFRAREIEPFMARQRDIAVEVATSEKFQHARILDVGCGTGWLGHCLLPFGKVTGTDLSPASIERGCEMFPGVELLCGDFLEMSLEGPFDLVISADVISHVYDQPRFAARVAELLRPGGLFVLMTQNAFVWNRSSRLQPLKPGQIRNWPSLRRVRALLQSDFHIERITSLVPGGDRGVLRWVDNRYVLGAMRRLLPGHDTWVRLLEAARLGRELVYVARRR